MRYLVYKHDRDLQGRTPQEFAKVEELSGVLCDLNGLLTSHCYGSGDRALCFSESKSMINRILMFLGKKKFLLGDNLTWVDFTFYEMCERMQCIFENFYEQFSDLNQYKNSFESIERIAKFLNSERNLNLIFNNKIAKINNKI